MTGSKNRNFLSLSPHHLQRGLPLHWQICSHNKYKVAVLCGNPHTKNQIDHLLRPQYTITHRPNLGPLG